MVEYKKKIGIIKHLFFAHHIRVYCYIIILHLHYKTINLIEKSLENEDISIESQVFRRKISASIMRAHISENTIF